MKSDPRAGDDPGGDSQGASRPGTGGDDPRVVAAVELYMAAREAGERPDRDAFLARFADVAGPLAECLSGLDLIYEGLGGGGPEGAAPAPGAATRDDDRGRRLGDYRLLREIGRGGMGAVYEAEQEPLGRRVALKLLPTAAALDPKQVQRFKLEAQAAALLNHPDIVPIFSVGVADRTHYYAMQLVAGPDLSAVIARLRRLDNPATASRLLRSPVDGLAATSAPARPGLGSTTAAVPARGPSSGRTTAPWASSARSSASARGRDFYRVAAELGARVAEALAHAHQLGVVHRDVKPANILLDARGKPWVTDFGLARLRDVAGPTASTDVLGTLAYMSPEQALGGPGPVDHRTDVYALGATLYELVTLRPVVSGADRREVLRRIAEEEPIPPRRLDPGIPTDLETILLKALAKAPVDRYATAQELADDLRRFLQDRPILAKAPSLRHRALKWTRRHQAIVGATAVAATAVIAALAATLVIVRGERDAARAAYAREADSLRRSDRNLELALRALDEIYLTTLGRQSNADPELERSSRELLARALVFYEAFAAENGGSRRAGTEAARASLRVAAIRRAFGQHAEAEDAARLGVARAEAVVAAGDGDPDARALLADGLGLRANLAQDTKDWTVAVVLCDRAIALRRGLVADEPGRADRRLALADELLTLGIVLDDAGREREAERVEREAIAVLNRCAAELPEASGATSLLRRRASAEFRLGRLLRKLKRHREAESALGRSVALGEGLVARPDAGEAERAQLANSSLEHGIVLALLGRGAEAEAAFRRCLGLREQLAREHPTAVTYQDGLSAGYHNLAQQLRRRGQVAEAERLLLRSLEIARGLAARVPGVPRHREGVAHTENSLATLRRAEGRLDEAAAAFGRAIAAWQGLVDDYPGVPDYRHRLATSHHDLGLTLARLERLDEAAPELLLARDLRRGLVRSHPDNAGFLEAIALGLGELGDVLDDLGRRDEAEAAFREAIDAWQTLIERDYDPQNSPVRLAGALIRLGDHLALLGRPAEAEGMIRRAESLGVPQAGTAPRDRPAVPTGRPGDRGGVRTGSPGGALPSTGAVRQ